MPWQPGLEKKHPPGTALLASHRYRPALVVVVVAAAAAGFV